ncbi:MAG: hypothetical protein HY426_02445 [Candidatus Levybacteria bacterium]|nr:hypothetical protein [Candidatus Levybacteria bacterium]
MKRLTALSIPAVSYLALVPSAFAVSFGAIDPCADNTNAGLNFNLLCFLGGEGIGELISDIITILFIIAVILAIAFLVYGGIKWIISGGDKTKVEAARGTIVAALVGLVLVFLSYFLINLITQFLGIGTLTGGSFSIPRLVP